MLLPACSIPVRSDATLALETLSKLYLLKNRDCVFLPTNLLLYKGECSYSFIQRILLRIRLKCAQFKQKRRKLSQHSFAQHLQKHIETFEWSSKDNIGYYTTGNVHDMNVWNVLQVHVQSLVFSIQECSRTITRSKCTGHKWGFHLNFRLMPCILSWSVELLERFHFTSHVFPFVLAFRSTHKRGGFW